MAKKKSFPDLTGDGKVTKADILKGRKVFRDGGKSSVELKHEYEKKMYEESKKTPAYKRMRETNLKKDFPGARTMKASGGLAVDEVGNPKGKKKSIQIQGWGKARH